MGILIVLLVLGGICYFLWKTSQTTSLVQNSGGPTKNVIKAGGRDVSFSYQPRNDKEPPFLILSIDGNFSGHAIFYSRISGGEGRLDRRVVMNDPAFDSEVYVECEDQDFISQFLKSSEARFLLRDMLRNFTRFEINGSRCLLIKVPCEGLAFLSADKMTAIAGEMVRLSGMIPLPPSRNKAGGLNYE